MNTPKIQRLYRAWLTGGLLLLILTGALAQPYGLTNRPPVGSFLNGALPLVEPSPAAWQATVAFPALTFDDPIVFAAEPNSTRLYIGERQGKIFFITNSPATSTKTLFLDLTAKTQGYNDCGVLGLAFHPQYGVAGSTNRGRVYVWYSYSPSPVGPGSQGYAPNDTDSYNRLSRFTVPDGSLVADPDSERVLINQFDRHLWHNGGGMFFGPDGLLYLTVGDEGGANDELNRSQKINAGLFGGVLRLDVDMNPTNSHPIRRQPLASSSPPGGWPATYSSNYFIPNDNPWQDAGGSVLEEFYAIGLRSPHRMTFDPPTSRIWVGDVGQNAWEEVSVIESGHNYQWAFREGFATGPKSQPDPVIGVSTPPVHDYAHASGNNCVIGGYVYRGTQFPSLVGKYVFGDNGSGRIWAMTYDGVNPTVVTQLCVMPAPPGSYGLASFGTDQNQELYLLVAGPGTSIYKLSASGGGTPPPALLSQTGTFTDAASLTPARPDAL
jgi:glucose/arabinose dehydrogenase